LLVDTLRLRGADVIGQVDLSERIHRNQSVDALSRMAFGILQVAARRLGDEGRLQGDDEFAGEYLQFRRTLDGVEPVPDAVPIVERPPIKTFASPLKGQDAGE